MEFVRLVAPGGSLFTAWVAAHWERRLKRHDYQTADVRAGAVIVAERLADIPLRCVGHLLLGLCKILRWKALRLEEDADMVRSNLLSSMATPGLPTVTVVKESDVTLRPARGEWLDPHTLPDLPDLGGLDMLMEPEMPAREIEAALEAGRRHTAPIEMITQRPEQQAQLRSELAFAEEGAFGAPSQEEHLLMDAVQAAAPAEQEPAPPGRPSIDQLLGIGVPDEQGLHPASGDLSSGDRGELPRPLAGAPRILVPPGDLEEAATPPQPLPLARALQFDGLAGPDSGDLGPRGPSAGSYLARLLELSPQEAAEGASVEGQPLAEEAAAEAEAEDALALLEQRPPMKKRRVRPWLDEETQIPTEVYHDTSAITRASLLDYSIRLPHMSPLAGITTTLSDLCPLLCELVRRAPAVGELRRRALAGAATPPPGGAAAAAAAPAFADLGGDGEPLSQEEIGALGRRPAPASPALAGVPGREGPSTLRSPLPGLHRGSLGTPLGEQPAPWVGADEYHTDVEMDVGPSQPDAFVPGGPPEESPWQRRRMEPRAVEPSAPIVYPGLDQAAVSAEQEAQLRSVLGPKGPDTISFLGLCEGPPGGPEAAAQRFLSLMSLHMEGAVTVIQEEPYADILIGRGPSWSTTRPAEEGGVLVAVS